MRCRLPRRRPWRLLDYAVFAWPSSSHTNRHFAKHSMTPKYISFSTATLLARVPFGLGFSGYSWAIMAVRTFLPCFCCCRWWAALRTRNPAGGLRKKAPSKAPPGVRRASLSNRSRPAWTKPAIASSAGTTAWFARHGAVVKGQPSASGSDAECFEPKGWWRRIEVLSNGQRITG